MYYVYALKSLVDGRIYVGFSSHVQRRVMEHNSGYVFSTKGYRPWELIHQESVNTRTEARIRERYLKSGIGKEFLKSISPVALRQLAEVGRML
jgi:putative endonuclease